MKVVLDWAYAPPHFFEEDWHYQFESGDVRIANGKVEATFAAATYDADPKVRERLEAELHVRFLGAQLIHPQPYSIQRGGLARVHPDGRRDIFVELQSAALAISAGTVDVRQTDSSGHVVYDSRQERLDRRRSLAERAAALRHDPALDAALRSFHASLSEPDVALVRIYEVREAIGRCLPTKSDLAQAGISWDDWRRLGDLCNDASINQARHRGKEPVAARRDATDAELAEARAIALRMIERYVEYRENQTGGPISGPSPATADREPPTPAARR